MSNAAKLVAHNFVDDLDVTSVLLTPQRCLLKAPLTHDIQSLAGSSRLGALVTLVDMAASDPALAACRPGWVATQDLSVHAAGWLRTGPVVVDARLVRLGNKTIVVAAEIYDGQGIEDFDRLQYKIDAGPRIPGGPTLASRSLTTFARLPGTAASDVDNYNPAQWIGQVRRMGTGARAATGMQDRIGLQVVDAGTGVVELKCNAYVINSIGTLNGGVQAMAFEAAAQAMRPELGATDIQIHFLAQLKTGPVRTLGTLCRDAPDHSIVTVQLVDTGAGDRILAMATVTLQRVPKTTAAGTGE